MTTIKSAAKTAAVRANAKKPRGKWVTAIAYEVGGVEKYKAFGSVIVRGHPPDGTEAIYAWLAQKVQTHGVGMQNEIINFIELSSSSMRV